VLESRGAGIPDLGSHVLEEEHHGQGFRIDTKDTADREVAGVA
jgi:hypothetical protein